MEIVLKKQNSVNLNHLSSNLMRKKFILMWSIISVGAFAQQIDADSLNVHNIQEVVVIGGHAVSAKESKPLSSIDEYLQKSSKIEMIKRGSYAWEPLLNNMPTERTVVTIDGMRIFGACTDKMDPVTSYVEVSNLSEAEIVSGAQGSEHGNTIGGAINLRRKLGEFGPQKWDFALNSGFESVNQQKIYGGSAAYKSPVFYADVSGMTRSAENYFAGNHTEVPFSQYKKINLSGNAGLKLGSNQWVETSLIYDKATNVGYPALPMDVSLAEAFIGSLKYRLVPVSDYLTGWETKIYYNNITHRMDDTQRPSVPIHMDMPGWSKTYGYYSQLTAELPDHHFKFNLNGFSNLSTAEMTMYPANSAEKLMFMYTWPQVRTLFQGVYLEDHFLLSSKSSLQLSGSLGFHSNKVESDFGLNSLQIFYPEMAAQKNRLLKSVAAKYRFEGKQLTFGFGGGFSDRAPSVSEGYGFYLFNSFEKYDYIGNPHLKNESSIELNAFAGLKSEGFSADLSASYFHISDYIVGKVLGGLVPMTIGAHGVKQYEALDFATIFDASLTTKVKLLQFLEWTNQLKYARGKDFEKKNLPFMSPFSYRSSLLFHRNKLSAEVSAMGNSKYNDFAAEYGESETSAFAVFNANIGYQFGFNGMKLLTKIGVENIFDKLYTTYSDWNKIPRPGRNFYLNINVNF